MMIILNIARKELLSNILIYRFIIGFIAVQVLMATSAYVLVKDYEQRLGNYQDARMIHQQQFREIKVFSQLLAQKVTLDRPPSPLSIFCSGFDRDVGNSVEINYDEVPFIATGHGQRNPLMSGFSTFDPIRVIQIVISLLTLLYAYDTISGEREKGTLSLMLSNAIPRYQILIGKYIGGIFSIFLFIATGFITSLWVVTSSTLIQFSGSDWHALSLIFFASLLYVSLLFMLGMLISCITKRSATTLIFILFLWVFFVFLIPNGAGYIASHFIKVDSAEKVDSKIQAVSSGMWRKVGNWFQTHPQPPSGISVWGGGLRGKTGALRLPQAGIAGTKGVMLYYRDIVEFGTPLLLQNADDVWRIRKDFLNQLEKQAAITKYISRFSPASLYYDLSSTLAETSIDAYEEFMNQVRRYRELIIEHAKKNDGFGLKFFTQADEKELLSSYQEEPSLHFVQGQVYFKFDEMKPLDGLPTFEYRPKAPLSRLESALFDMLTLLILNIVSFMAAHIAFQRTSVK
jgi:ABC-type transport system involved in multi-copper enzyme maturation permease subunit